MARLLDTTLRDGGNQNKWDFSTDAVARIITELDESGVHVIEVGYRGGSGSNVENGLGPSARCDAVYLASLPAVRRATLAAMVVPKVCALDDALSLSDTPVELVRVAIYPWDVALAPHYVAALHDVGLAVSVNLMALSYVDEAELADIAELFVEASTPDLFYVADSFGALNPARVASLVATLNSATPANVGVHFHNNLGLAAANTLAAMGAGATWVDGSLSGMARGAGNLPTEQAAVILSELTAAESSIDAVRIATVAEYVSSEVMPAPMRTGLDEIRSGLNNHHFYFQDAINRHSKTHDVDANELGRRVGRARPHRVDHDLVASLAAELKETK